LFPRIFAEAKTFFVCPLGKIYHPSNHRVLTSKRVNGLPLGIKILAGRI